MRILALDLGKYKTTACFYHTDDQTAAYRTFKTAPFVLFNEVARWRPDRVVFEVGTSAGWVHDVVRQVDNVEIEVANPTHEGWRWRHVKRKTDRLDALKLARLSAVGQLPQVHMPSRAVRERRALIRYREQLIARRTRIKNTIRSLLHRQGRAMPSGHRAWTQASLETLRSLSRQWSQVEVEDLWRATLGEELDALEQVAQRLARVEAKLNTMGRQDAGTRLLQTIPGVGPRLAETIVAVIDDPHRFATGRQVAAYAGLTPRQFQSGQMDRSGRISKQGNGLLRKLLVEVGWLMLRYNPHLAAFYRRVCRGSRGRRKIAVVAVARKLLVTAWAMLRDGRCWSPPALPSQAA
ncbi:MAG: IS110 family RNA-guided transposase [Planctomycetota bacterium]|jgi:transposase